MQAHTPSATPMRKKAFVDSHFETSPKDCSAKNEKAKCPFGFVVNPEAPPQEQIITTKSTQKRFQSMGSDWPSAMLMTVFIHGGLSAPEKMGDAQGNLRVAKFSQALRVADLGIINAPSNQKAHNLKNIIQEYGETIGNQKVLTADVSFPKLLTFMQGKVDRAIARNEISKAEGDAAITASRSEFGALFGMCSSQSINGQFIPHQQGSEKRCLTEKQLQHFYGINQAKGAKGFWDTIADEVANGQRPRSRFMAAHVISSAGGLSFILGAAKRFLPF